MRQTKIYILLTIKNSLHNNVQFVHGSCLYTDFLFVCLLLFILEGCPFCFYVLRKAISFFFLWKHLATLWSLFLFFKNEFQFYGFLVCQVAFMWHKDWYKNMISKKCHVKENCTNFYLIEDTKLNNFWLTFFLAFDTC